MDSETNSSGQVRHQSTPGYEAPNPLEQPSSQRSQHPQPNHPSLPMRHVSLDRILQGSSDIPSGQPRVPPRLRSLAKHKQPQQQAHHGQQIHQAQPSRRVFPSRGIPNTTSRTGQHIPARTTKLSEKLVLLPEAEEEDSDAESEAALHRRLAEEVDDGRPLRDEEREILRKRGGIRGKSYAERLPKAQRGARTSRLTAYCIAQAFKMKPAAAFLKKHHEARTKLYDDCLYVIYALPLLSGSEGYRVRSRAILKTPGTGKTVVDLEIERSEQADRPEHEHEDGYFDDDGYPSSETRNIAETVMSPSAQPNGSGEAAAAHSPSEVDRRVANAKNFAEMFIFSYGVVVFWNFTEAQERDILADLTFAENDPDVGSLLTRPLEQDSYETEAFHFEYSADIARPRIFNDMITLLPRFDHMTKLAISHAIAQSTKLCFFEERMSQTMLDAQHVPKDLALTGELNMGRTEVVKILGRLFKSRVDINLSSNMLDVPKFFWDSEPTLHPLYVASREYLEIDHRIRVLNERCRVFLDLAEILTESVADTKMSNITWIIIILIAVSIVVTVSEVILRFVMLDNSRREREREGELLNGTISGPAVEGIGLMKGVPEVSLGRNGEVNLERGDVLGQVTRLLEGVSLEELRRWRMLLSSEQVEEICGAALEGLAGVES